MMMLIFCTCFIDRPSRDPVDFDKPKILFSKFRCKGLPNKLTIWFLLVRFFSLFVFVKKRYTKNTHIFLQFFFKMRLDSSFILLIIFRSLDDVKMICSNDTKIRRLVFVSGHDIKTTSVFRHPLLVVFGSLDDVIMICSNDTKIRSLIFVSGHDIIMRFVFCHPKSYLFWVVGWCQNDVFEWY